MGDLYGRYDGENWWAADGVAREIISKVQPTTISEEKRKSVVKYIQRLIRSRLGAEVFPYGSVPLKTYLPDGDIDLTVFSTNVEDSLAEDMKSILEEEEKNRAAEFVVKDVQLICAEVKIVKCIVQDIVVDVSFNQIGGLCTLCFLEQVDRAIGKDHLFKNSIILIKAWCYYESRILGAHHGLISTYALETLVLYIFHLYHSILDGPLDVLYKFLDYFSKFSWETYCISLDGPLLLSALPSCVADMPEDSDKTLLLSREFLNSCVGMFSVPFRDSESSRGFQKKFFNIIDPLKEINNLGRSVNRGNYYRIRSAFSYGAKKLAQILVQPQHCIANELHKFFANTMARHGGGPRPDVLDNISAMPNHDNFDEYFDEHTNLTTSGLDGLKISTDTSTSQISCPNEKVDAVPHFAPHLFFSKSKQDDCSVRNPSLDSDKLDKSESQLVDKNEVVASSKTEDVIRDQRSTSLLGDAPEIVINSSDLAGDYRSYIQYLQYGRSCFEDGFGMHALPMPPFVDASYQNSIMWDSLLHYKQNGFSHHQNGFHPVYAVPPVFVPYGWEDVSKPRGTGTYFPNMNMPFQGYRPIKGRNHGPIRASHNSGRNFVFTEPNVLDRSNHEPSHHQVMVSSSDSYLPFSPHQNNGYHTANELFIPSEAVELEEINRPISSAGRSYSGRRTSQSASSKQGDRSLSPTAYHLKDYGDFPPLM